MSFCRIALLMAIVWLEAVPNAFGALSPKVLTSGIPPAPDGERFLFVVETSSAMEDLQSANEATLYDLIHSGINGYMRPGDTFGLWTYNKEVQTGQFPMRVWEPRQANQQATIAAAFLNQQKYENSASLKDVMANLSKVIHAVSNLTVLVVSDGGERSFGTPFDRSIAADYKKLARERRQAKRPFVTTLVVRGGWFVEAKVAVSMSDIRLPERPSALAASVTTTNQPVTTATIATTAPTPTTAPTNRARGTVLAIRDVDGRTNSPAIPAPALNTPQTDQTAAENSARVVQTPLPITNPTNPPATANPTPAASLVAGAAAPLPATPPPAIPPVPGRPKVMQIITKTNSSPNPAAAPAPATLAETSAAPPAAQPAPAQPAPVQPAPAQPPVQLATVSLAPPAPTTTVPPPTITSNTITTAASSASDPPPSRPTVIAISSPPASPPPPAPPSPLPVAARELNPGPSMQTTVTNGTSEETTQAAINVNPNVKSQTLEALAAPARTGFNWMLVYGVLLLAITLCLFRIVLRRARATAHGSIITQSMERR